MRRRNVNSPPGSPPQPPPDRGTRAPYRLTVALVAALLAALAYTTIQLNAVQAARVSDAAAAREALAAADAAAEREAIAAADAAAAREALTAADAAATREAIAAADAAAAREALAAADPAAREALAAADAAAVREAIAAANARAASPDEARRTAHRAFLAAEAWRQEAVNALYANITDADWDTAARWKRYAAPDAPERTCGVAALPPELLSDIQRLARVVAALPSPPSNRSRSAYLALHAFHTTGLEGNVLTLPETLLTVAGQPLLGGYDARVKLSPAREISVTEVRNVAQLWDALGLADFAGRKAPPLDLTATAGVQMLLDLNSAITRGTGTPVGLRTRPVAIGHQRVLLPMPDEVPVLLHEFLAWLTTGLRTVATAAPAGAGGGGGGARATAGSGDTGDRPRALEERALALACDAHTRFVFVHPFTDGNGRTARTLAGLVLQNFGLPGPMFTREQRSEYMAAVSAATGTGREYAPLAALHAAAVRRSLACQIALSEAAVSDPADVAALERGDCTLG